jgi:hypothetical protein
MPKKILVAATLFAIAFFAIACRRHKYHQPNTAADLAANVLDIASEALLRDDGGPKWDELDRRLDVLFANNTKEADEAVVILVSFYLGEHECEEVDENLVSRGPRMIPLVERYLRDEPSSLLHEYPRRVRLKRETTVGHLEEDLKLLQAQVGVSKQEPSKASCQQRDAAFERKIESIKQDASEQLKIGTKKADVSKFFVKHNMPFAITGSEAIGTLYTTGGCAPRGCGTDRALIGVRVKVDADGTVTGNPYVGGMYVDCV